MNVQTLQETVQSFVAQFDEFNTPNEEVAAATEK